MSLPRRFLLGASYWSRAGGPRMWERFDEGVVRAELAALRGIGLDCLRVFALAPTFLPRPPAVDAAALATMARFADMTGEAGLSLLPTLLVGHMSGENFDLPGQGGRSLYRDPELRAWQAALVRGVVGALAGKRGVLGWILTNEMPLWGGPAAADEVTAWADEMIAAARDADGTRPVGTGDGAMPGWPTGALAPHLGWIGPHVYYGDVDPLRQAWNTDLVLRQMARFGRPVVLEEVGASSTQAGEGEHAAYLREAILAAFGAGARGALVWCASDFDDRTVGLETPYAHHPFELRFGLLRADGTEKPACEELRALRRLVDGLGDAAVSRPPARAALLASDWIDQPFPFSWEDKALLRRALLQAHVLLAQAGLDVDVVGEEDDLGAYALVVVPSTQKLRVPTWHKLEASARAGATVYWSYFSGENEFHQGAWCPSFERLTGLRHRLRYGCFDLPGEQLTLRGRVSLTLPTGLSRSTTPQSMSRLPIEPLPGAAVTPLAVDGAGRLALAEHRLGQGRFVFCAYPVERYLMARADGSRLGAHRLYRLLAGEAGLGPAHDTHHPEVQALVLHQGTDDLVVVQNRGTDTVDDASRLGSEGELLYDRGNPSPRAFGPKGARVWRLRGVRAREEP